MAMGHCWLVAECVLKLPERVTLLASVGDAGRLTLPP